MRFSPTSTEQAVLETLSSKERFRYAITRICECEEVWSLGDDRGWLIREIDERQTIAIWPYRRMAEAYQLEERANNEPVCVSLEHFLYTLLKQCERNGIVFEVNPAQSVPGCMVTALQLYEVLENMMETGAYFLEG